MPTSAILHSGQPALHGRVNTVPHVVTMVSTPAISATSLATYGHYVQNRSADTDMQFFAWFGPSNFSGGLLVDGRKPSPAEMVGSDLNVDPRRWVPHLAGGECAQHAEMSAILSALQPRSPSSLRARCVGGAFCPSEFHDLDVDWISAGLASCYAATKHLHGWGY